MQVLSPEDARFPPRSDSTWAVAPRPLGSGLWSATLSDAKASVVCDAVRNQHGFLYVYVACQSRIPIDAIPGPLASPGPAGPRNEAVDPLPKRVVDIFA